MPYSYKTPTHPATRTSSEKHYTAIVNVKLHLHSILITSEPVMGAVSSDIFVNVTFVRTLAFSSIPAQVRVMLVLKNSSYVQVRVMSVLKNSSYVKVRSRDFQVSKIRWIKKP